MNFKELEKRIDDLCQEISNSMLDFTTGKNGIGRNQKILKMYQPLATKYDKIINEHITLAREIISKVKKNRKALPRMHRQIIYLSGMLLFAHWAGISVSSSSNQNSLTFFGISVSGASSEEIIIGIIVYMNIAHSLVAWNRFLKLRKVDSDFVQINYDMQRCQRKWLKLLRLLIDHSSHAQLHGKKTWVVDGFTNLKAVRKANSTSAGIKEINSSLIGALSVFFTLSVAYFYTTKITCECIESLLTFQVFLISILCIGSRILNYKIVMVIYKNEIDLFMLSFRDKKARF